MQMIVKYLSPIIFTLSLSPSLAESLTINDLIKKDDMYYDKFSNTLFTGTVTGYEVGSFQDGKRNGYWQFYYESGQLKSEETYNNGKRYSIKSYHENGKAHMIMGFNDKGRDGNWRFYYKNGQLRYKGDFINGKHLDGTEEYYFENGNLKTVHRYKHNLANGNWEYFNEDGQLIALESYKDGEEDGEFKQYYEDGTIKEIWLKKNGETTVSSSFNEDGNLFRKIYDDITELYYPNGSIKSKSIGELFKPLLVEHYNEKGQLILRTNYNKDRLKNGIQEVYDEEGELRFKRSYKNDKLNGPSEGYEEGRLIARANFIDGSVNGVVETFYTTGAVETKSHMIGEIQDGPSMKYYPNGQLEFSGYFKKGLIDGLWKHYNENGELIGEEFYRNGKLIIGD